VTVDVIETFEEAGDCSGADCKMAADFDVARSKFSGSHGNALPGLRIFTEEEVLRKEFAEASVGFANSFDGGGTAMESTIVDPLLDGDVGAGLLLQIALAGISAVVLVQGSFDVDGVGVMAFDQVAVVAVHGSDKGGQGLDQTGWEAAAEGGGAVNEVEG
jgi:hypothetical protein